MFKLEWSCETEPYLEVNKEYDQSKVDQGMGGRNEVSLSVQDEDDGGCKAGLRGTKKGKS